MHGQLCPFQREKENEFRAGKQLPLLYISFKQHIIGFFGLCENVAEGETLTLWVGGDRTATNC